MRLLVLIAMLAGCGFGVGAGPLDGPGDDSGSDASGSDASGSDALPDGPVDVMPATITYVQGAMGVGSSVKPVFTLAQPSMAGDLCVLGIGVQGANVASVTDASGSTYANESNTGGLHVYVAANMVASATNTVSVALDQTAGFTGAVACYRGLATVSPVDAKSASSGTGNAMDSGGTSPTQHTHDLVVGVAASNGAMIAGGGMTTRTNSTTSMIADREVSASTSYHAVATSGTNVSWAMAVLALKAAD